MEILAKEVSLVTLPLWGVIIYSVLRFVYQALKGPLGHIPGPPISRWTRLRLKYAVLSGDRSNYTHNLHARYGPIVRISPNEVSFASVSAARYIYRMGSDLYKDEAFYGPFSGTKGREKGLFAMTNPEQHAMHRKVQARNFTDASIRKLEPMVMKNMKLAMEQMAKDVKESGYCDVSKWFMLMATDVVGEASFGESFQMLETGRRNQYIEDVETVGKRGNIRVEFPFLMQVIAAIPTKASRQLRQAIQRLNKYAEESIQRYYRQIQADPESAPGTLLSKDFENMDRGEISYPQLVANARGNIIAGTDSTAIAATYATWLLSQHPHCEKQLIDALRSLPASYTDDDLRRLKYLDYVIQETLRFRSPIAERLPRLAPPGGCTIADTFIPGGITVGVPTWSLHRDPQVWNEPDEFMPNRWENATREMRDSFVPFGGGSRVCIGQHLAMMELRHTLAAFYRRFDRGMAPAVDCGFTISDMEPKSYFLTAPRGKRCLLTCR